MTKTATGMPSTWLGYWFGRLLCRVGLHHRTRITFWEYGPGGDRIVTFCVRDCQWSAGLSRSQVHRIINEEESS